MKFVLCLCTVLCHTVLSDKPQVTTLHGSVVGETRTTETGLKFHAFEGIPYAKPPINELRFKPPLPLDSWEGDFEANNPNIFCIQALFGPTIGTEDCLYLNVYTPQLSHSLDEPLSVMVFIHGGGFVGGSSSPTFSGMPDYLIEHGVVLVSINYRLGPMGFLSTEDAEAPGNYGMLDQVAALQWVKNNIMGFGGNHNDVTILGESAGSASVHLLMLSPLTKGLFHRAVSQSGTALSPYAITRLSKKRAQSLAEKLQCPVEPSSELLQCLRKKDAKEIIETKGLVSKENSYGILPLMWTPRVDIEGDTPFLPKLPLEIMMSGNYNRVPWIVGYNKHEGSGIVAKSLPGMEAEEYQDMVWNDFNKLCRIHLSMEEYPVDRAYTDNLCETIWRHYINEDIDKYSQIDSYVELNGDMSMVAQMVKSIEVMSKHIPIYTYRFDFDSKQYCLISIFVPAFEKVPGIVTHGDELLYLFKYPNIPFSKEDPEYKMMQHMTSMWTSFAKTGVPSHPYKDITWQPVEGPDYSVFVINAEPAIGRKMPHHKFWDNILQDTLYNTKGYIRDEL